MLLLVAACQGGDRTQVASDSTTIAVDTRTAHGRAGLELWQLRSGVTFADWFLQHVDDEVAPFEAGVTPSDAWGSWCVKSTAFLEAGGLPMRRTAFFYPPDPQAPVVLPDSAPLDMARQCELGLIGIEIPVADAPAGAPVADSVRALLARGWGAAVPTGQLSFFGSAFWSGTSLHRRGDVTVIGALAAPPAREGDSLRARVLAFAFLPGAGISVERSVTGNREPVTDSIPFDSALALAAADTAATGRMRRLMQVAASGAPRTDSARADAAELVAALRRWLTVSGPFPPVRRAAALYAADRLLAQAMCTLISCDAAGDSVALAPLRALGARFSWPPLGVGWVYEHSWLAQARALDRDTPLGQRILLFQMGRAFDFSGSCREGADGWQRVVSNADAYLARVPSSPIAAEVHYLAAVAWSDVVALAAGAAGDYADASRYTPRAAEARSRAITHYRAVIAADPGAEIARAAWRNAWWMMSGFAPRTVRFLCVHD